MYNFPVVFQSIMVEARDQAHLQRCIQYIEVKTGHKLSELFLTNRQMVLVELLTMIQVNKSRVVKGLAMCAMAERVLAGASPRARQTHQRRPQSVKVIVRAGLATLNTH